jgi:hypothetical protein|tara:strand:+ start:493 stop:744 length:252 start_codon:yes stop_codon:yes gene_type:complete
MSNLTWVVGIVGIFLVFTLILVFTSDTLQSINSTETANSGRNNITTGALTTIDDFSSLLPDLAVVFGSLTFMAFVVILLKKNG